MRKFTREHNHLDWLFPDDEKLPGELFSEYENKAEKLLELAFGDKDVFTRDDMIDAFMKGTSEAHRNIMCR